MSDTLYSGEDFSKYSDAELEKQLKDLQDASRKKSDSPDTLANNMRYFSDESNAQFATAGIGGAAGALYGLRKPLDIAKPGETLQEAVIKDPRLKAKLPEFFSSQTVTEGIREPRFSIFHKTYYNPHSLDKGVLQEPTERFGRMINELEPKNQHIDPHTGKVSYIETPLEIAERERAVARLRNQMVPGVRELTAQPWAPYNNTRYTNPNVWGTKVPPSYERWETNSRSGRVYGDDIPKGPVTPAGGPKTTAPDKPTSWHPLDIYRQPGKIEDAVLKAIDKVAPEGTKRDALLKAFTKYGDKALSIPWVAKTLNVAGGFATGYGALEALNRAHQGDYKGALFSGLEAGGGALSLAPHPLAKAAGFGLSGLGFLGNQFLHDKK